MSAWCINSYLRQVVYNLATPFSQQPRYKSANKPLQVCLSWDEHCQHMLMTEVVGTALLHASVLQVCLLQTLAYS